MVEFIFTYICLQVASTRNIHDKAQSELDLVRMKIKECDSQISGILKEQQKLQNKLSESSLERKKMENEVNNFPSCSQWSISYLNNLLPKISIGKANGDGAERLLYKSRQIDREACLDCF